MKKTFSYSILQYQHSLLLNEAINVGILFVFPEDETMRYVSGNLLRLKLIYSNFDTATINHITVNIETRVKTESKGLFNIFTGSKNTKDFFISFLRDDDSSLQFSRHWTVPYPFESIDKIVDQYSKMLLPDYGYKKNPGQKQNEHFILRKFNQYLFGNNKNLEGIISKNKVIDSHGIKLKFDLSWDNGTTNLVKPVSFDLNEPQEIQTKSITYFGYLTKLDEYAKENNIRYDLLVWLPQDKNLFKDYDKAISILESAPAPKKIIVPDQLKTYCQEAAHYLQIKLENNLKEES